MSTPNPSGSDVLTTRPTPFELPLQSSDYIDDIRDNAGKLAIQLYGSLSDPKIIARRDYVIRAVNSFDDMLAALKFVKNFFAKMEEHDLPGDPLIELRRKFHAPVHAELDKALAKAEGR